MFLWQNPEITTEAFLKRLENEGPLTVDTIVDEESISLKRYDEAAVSRVLGPTLDSLTVEENLTLEFAAVLPAESLPWSWLRELVMARFEKFGADVIRGRMAQDTIFQRRTEAYSHIEKRAHFLAAEWFHHEHRGEVDAMIPACFQAIDANAPATASRIASIMDETWLWLDNVTCLHIYEKLLPSLETRGEIIEIAEVKAAYAGHVSSFDPDLADKFAREAAELVAKCPNAPSAVMAKVAHMLALHGEIPKLRILEREQLELALKYARSAGTDGLLKEIAILNNLGTSFVLNKPSKALPLFEQAHEKATERFPTDHPALAICLANIGWALTNLGQHERALEMVQTALTIDKKSLPPNHNHFEFHLCNLANVLCDLGRHDEAIQAAKKAIKIGIRRETGPFAMAGTISRLAMCEQQAGRYSEARQNYLNVVALWKEAPSEVLTDNPDIYTRLGFVCEKLNHFDEAIQWYCKPRDLSVEVEDLFSSNTIGANSEFYELLTSEIPSPEIVLSAHPENRPAVSQLVMDLGNRLGRFGITVGFLEAADPDLSNEDRRICTAKFLRHTRAVIIIPTDRYLANSSCLEDLRELWWRCLAAWIKEPTKGIAEMTNPMMPSFTVMLMGESELRQNESLFRQPYCSLPDDLSEAGGILDTLQERLLEMLLGTRPSPKPPSAVEVWHQLFALDYKRQDIDPERVKLAMSERSLDPELTASRLSVFPCSVSSEWLVLLRAVSSGVQATWAFNYNEVQKPNSHPVMQIMQNNKTLMAARHRKDSCGVLVSLAYNFRIVSELQHAYYCFVHYYGRDSRVDLATIAAMYICLQMYGDVVKSESQIIELLVTPLLEGHSIEDRLAEE